MERYDEALSSLQQLSEVAPKEAPIYFLLGKIFKRQKQLEAAVLNFTVAMDLDPKNSNNIKAIIDKVNQPDVGEEVELT
jgi:anaphase-promoting complex subunit 3